MWKATEQRQHKLSVFYNTGGVFRSQHQTRLKCLRYVCHKAGFRAWPKIGCLELASLHHTSALRCTTTQHSEVCLSCPEAPKGRRGHFHSAFLNYIMHLSTQVVSLSSYCDCSYHYATQSKHPLLFSVVSIALNTFCTQVSRSSSQH